MLKFLKIVASLKKINGIEMVSPALKAFKFLRIRDALDIDLIRIQDAMKNLEQEILAVRGITDEFSGLPDISKHSKILDETVDWLGYLLETNLTELGASSELQQKISDFRKQGGITSTRLVDYVPIFAQALKITSKLDSFDKARIPFRASWRALTALDEFFAAYAQKFAPSKAPVVYPAYSMKKPTEPEKPGPSQIVILFIEALIYAVLISAWRYIVWSREQDEEKEMAKG